MNYKLLDLLFKLSTCDNETFNKYFNVIREHLFDNEDKSLIDSIDFYISKYNRYPSVDFLIDFVDSYNKSKDEIRYKIKNYTESLDYYYDGFVEYAKIKYKEILSRSVLNSSDVDIELTFSKYNKLLKKLEFKSNDIFVKRDFNVFIEEYKNLRDKGDNDLIPTQFRFIDSTTGGIGRSDFILFVSRPQSFKTWTMCQLSVNFSRVITNGKILFFSKEMSKTQILKRILSIVGNLNYEDIKRLRIKDEDIRLLEDKVNAELDSEIIIIGKEDDVLYDINYVRTKIMSYNPDVVIIDGLYLFALSDEWVEHSKISRAFRDMSLRLNVPIIGTLQFSRKGYGRGNIAYSDSYEQDASLFIGMERQEDESKSYTNEVIMSILKARDGRVDMRSSFVFDYTTSTLIEKTITDVVAPVSYKKLESVSSKLNKKDISLLADILRKIINKHSLEDMTDKELMNKLNIELNKSVIVNNKEMLGRLSTNESDRFYYFQIQDFIFRVYVSNYTYLNYYKFIPVKSLDLRKDSLVIFSSSISAQMINDFIKEISNYFNRGGKEKISKNSNIPSEIFEKYLKWIFYFKDPLTNILILLNGNLRYINIDNIGNDYLKELLGNTEYSDILRYYIVNMFYDFDEEDNKFYLRDKYLRISYSLEEREKMLLDILNSFESHRIDLKEKKNLKENIDNIVDNIVDSISEIDENIPF